MHIALVSRNICLRLFFFSSTSSSSSCFQLVPAIVASFPNADKAWRAAKEQIEIS
jgi:hypothetical protein